MRKPAAAKVYFKRKWKPRAYRGTTPTQDVPQLHDFVETRRPHPTPDPGAAGIVANLEDRAIYRIQLR